MAGLACGSGFSLIFSVMKSMIITMPSIEPVIRQTRSLVPTKTNKDLSLILLKSDISL